jgi:16S rRNA (uracil1498-N3)-methyltransferase
MVTELGVDEIHLALTERAISRPDERRAKGRVERLAKIAGEAARQARRRTVPVIHPAAPLAEVGARASSDAACLVFWEEGTQPLPEAIEADEVWVLVGPEGGLSHTELGSVPDFHAVGLGSTILRVETAAPTAVALVLDRVGRLRPVTGSDR